jgi:RHS repeat-associated protein
MKIPNIVSTTDYYPFGMPMPSRTFTGNGYRYGFNGQEKENEIYGEGNTYSAEYWMYDSRLGRRWNLDPVDQISISNYATFANNPIANVDPDGAWVIGAGFWRNVFKSDDRITAEDYADDLEGSAYKVNDIWFVSYFEDNIKNNGDSIGNCFNNRLFSIKIPFSPY